MFRVIAGFVFALAVAGMLLAQEAEKKVVDLPVTRAVLFHSGVGYFEHAGTVEGDATLRLNFKEKQINDVLKSMVLTDLDGGTISTVTYPSNEPLARALSSFSVDISGNPTFPDLLNQLRGAKVTVRAPEEITGNILNVEARTSIVGPTQTQITEHVLNLVTPLGFRAIPLSTVQALTLSDAKLQEELNKALSLLVQSRDQDTKPVEIRFTGKGSRKVRVGYLVETPVWKTSYRLDLSGDKPLLQGWAIVENTGDADWKDVTLSLVSGQPISFVQDLYTPLYATRPVVQPELYASLMPRRYDEGTSLALADKELREVSQERLAGVRTGDMRKLQRPAAPSATAAPAGPVGNMGSLAYAGAAMDADAFGRGVQSVATAEKLAELFRFTIASPVDLSRRKSAMLPIVNQPIKAEKVSIYNQSVMAKHPLNGVYLTNNTDLKLLGGPVTVFDGGAYAGDAQVNHLNQNDKRLLSYAVDLAVTVDPSVTSTASITAAKLVKGTLHVNQMHEYTHVYAISSKAEAKRSIIIEHPFINGRKLLEPTTYEEKTPSVYRFRTSVDAGGGGKFTVKEQQVNVQLIALVDHPADALVYFVRQSAIDPKVRDALQQAIALKQQLAALERQLQDRRQQLNEIQSGQSRLRENLKSVGSSSNLGARYIAKLADEENQIEELQEQLGKLQQQIEAKRRELADFLEKLSVG